jgi:hypothetical protein
MEIPSDCRSIAAVRKRLFDLDAVRPSMPTSGVGIGEVGLAFWFAQKF